MLEGWYFGERDTKDSGSLLELPSFDQRGSLMDKASSVQWNSNADALRDAQANNESTDDVETNIRYGFFCLTFMYFRALRVIQKEKVSISIMD